ncbi:MAG: UDP-N-acetylglucosamine 2-epimerase (non-hydrolyzing) [Actinomycetota bacterium]|nr:UDP-N-acetylglucosamine 2-epimerase (non-hydrolyzing) [Actinomycetota bacterium]
MRNTKRASKQSDVKETLAPNHSLIFILGTRPEAIKLAPVILEAQKHTGVDIEIVLTGQHPTMCISALESFGIQPTRIMNTLKDKQTILQLSAEILIELSTLNLEWKQSIVLVQGDTTSALFGAYAGFIMGSKIGHIEAGLRTSDSRIPFPEEMNRRLITRLADIHFCATKLNALNLQKEGISENMIHVTGNTIIDALVKMTTTEIHKSKRDIILVTLHRRENQARVISEVTRIIDTMAREEEIKYVWKVIRHPNPETTAGYSEDFLHNPRVEFLSPLPYPEMVSMLRKTKLLITDSGGFQEEATYLGIPTLIIRNKTERPEALESGVCVLIKDPVKELKKSILELLLNEELYLQRSKPSNIFGDAAASNRIINLLLEPSAP